MIQPSSAAGKAKPGPSGVVALAAGALALGAAAIGALAVGAIKVRRLKILEARRENLSFGIPPVDPPDGHAHPGSSPEL